MYHKDTDARFAIILYKTQYQLKSHLIYTHKKTNTKNEILYLIVGLTICPVASILPNHFLNDELPSTVMDFNSMIWYYRKGTLDN